MNFSNSFKSTIKSINAENFESKALELFEYQFKHNKIYHKYVNNLGIATSDINRLEEIPFLPISFFKNHSIKTGEWSPVATFESSGTTGMQVSKHYVRSVEEYLVHAQGLFEQQYGKLTDYHILALLPSYLERKGSSLVFMVEHFIKCSQSEYSGFYLNNLDDLALQLKGAYHSGKKVLLIGVSFGLLDFVEKHQFELPELLVMETGGMKGRRKEMVREELHNILKEGFGVPSIHSEYGMTELLSQAYSKGAGVFQPTATLNVLIRDTNDPFSYMQKGRTGGINIIDLANVDTCAFLETQDLGKILPDNSFEIIGRFDNSDIRGCNLMAI